MLARLLLPLLFVLGACTSAGDEPDAAPDRDEPVSTEPPAKGACRLLTAEDIEQASNETEPVDCKDKHTAETFAVGDFPADIAGGVAGERIDDRALGAHVFESCETKFRRFLGGNESLVMRATVTWAWFRPSQDAWDAGARWWRCDVVGGGEESTDLVDLPRTTKGILLGRPHDRWMACVDGPSVAEGSAKVACSEQHTWRAVTTIVLGGGDEKYPGDDVVAARTRDFCSKSVGAWLNYPVEHEFGYTFFHEAEWKAGNRRSVCWARTTQ